MRTTGLMYVHRREQEEEGNAAAVMLPMEKVLQLKAVKVVSRTIISPSSPESGLPLPKIPADNRAKIPAAKSLSCVQVTIWIYIFQLLLIHAVWSAREEMQEAHLLHYLLIVRNHKSFCGCPLRNSLKLGTGEN